MTRSRVHPFRQLENLQLDHHVTVGYGYGVTKRVVGFEIETDDWSTVVRLGDVILHEQDRGDIFDVDSLELRSQTDDELETEAIQVVAFAVRAAVKAAQAVRT